MFKNFQELPNQTLNIQVIAKLGPSGTQGNFDVQIVRPRSAMASAIGGLFEHIKDERKAADKALNQCDMGWACDYDKLEQENKRLKRDNDDAERECSRQWRRATIATQQRDRLQVQNQELLNLNDQYREQFRNMSSEVNRLQDNCAEFRARLQQLDPNNPEYNDYDVTTSSGL